jgi:hypothetical protein
MHDCKSRWPCFLVYIFISYSYSAFYMPHISPGLNNSPLPIVNARKYRWHYCTCLCSNFMLESRSRDNLMLLIMAYTKSHWELQQIRYKDYSQLRDSSAVSLNCNLKQEFFPAVSVSRKEKESPYANTWRCLVAGNETNRCVVRSM